MRIRIVAAAVSLFVLCGVAAAWTQLHRGKAFTAADARAEEGDQKKADPNIVIVGDEKLSSLDLRVQPAERHVLREIHVVPGRIDYDDSHRVDIRATANGILVQMRVMPGDRVVPGQVLATVSSPEIGLARTEVHHAQENWELTAKKQEWVEETSNNVAALVEGLKRRTPMNELENQFRGKTLGKAREKLISAYSRFLLAESLSKSAETVGRDVLPSVTVMERLAERRSAEAAPAGCLRAGWIRSCRGETSRRDRRR